MKIIYFLALVSVFSSCNKKDEKSSVKTNTKPVIATETKSISPKKDSVQRGRENRPVVTKLKIKPGSAPIDWDWTAPTGHEYWLFGGQNGTTGMVAGGYGGTYRPYGGGTDISRCLAGDLRFCRRVCGEPSQDYERQVQNPEWCKTKPSELARRCAYQTGLALKAILDNPPKEYTAWIKRNSKPSIMGWINDGAALGYSGRMPTGPFKWKTYLIWSGSVKADGTCISGSLGQFLKWLKQYDGHKDFRK